MAITVKSEAMWASIRMRDGVHSLTGHALPVLVAIVVENCTFGANSSRDACD